MNKDEKHYFVAPKKEDANYHSDRFCGKCGKYLTDDVHVRFDNIYKANRDNQ